MNFIKVSFNNIDSTYSDQNISVLPKHQQILKRFERNSTLRDDILVINNEQRPRASQFVNMHPSSLLKPRFSATTPFSIIDENQLLLKRRSTNSAGMKSNKVAPLNLGSHNGSGKLNQNLSCFILPNYSYLI